VLALANVLWAGSYVAGKAVLATWPFASLNMLRFTIGAAALAPVLWRGRRQLPRAAPDRWRLAAMCVLGFGATKALEYLGLGLTSATDTALLIAAEGLATVGLSWLFLHERIGRMQSLGLAAGLVGVYIVVERGLRLPIGLAGPGTLGNVLVVLALVFEAGFTIVGATIATRYPPLLITAVVVTGSLLVWWPAGLAALALRGWPGLTPAGILGVTYMGLVSTAICYWAWFYGLRRVRPGSLAPLLFIQPVVGTLLAVWIRGERPGAATVVGGALVLCGVATVVRERRPGPRVVPAGPPPA